jgi:IS5 family transposase
LVDGPERPVQKPKDTKKRKKVYSGKKKTTTRKHIVISNPKKRILVLGKSKTGRRHDWRIAERQQLLDQLPPEVTAWMDSGFIGADRVHSNSQICAKATKKHPLTKAQKQNNRVISSFRIPVEHANAGMKRMKAAADIWRNKTGGMDDHVMLIAAGLWNFYLEYTEQDQIDKQLRLLQTAG